MQMQPATAIAVAPGAGTCATPSRDALFDPAIAVPLGAAYVRELLDRYGNQLDLSLAAYNAGPVSVARWMPSQPIDADVWIENIPYTETRGYVEHISSTSSPSPPCAMPSRRGSPSLMAPVDAAPGTSC